jgi:carbon-monoxide dehydrogenase large subunit
MLIKNKRRGEMEEFKFIGKSVKRLDEKEKVTGAAKYVDDIDFGPNLLYAEIIESPHPHALIKSIDTSEAEKMEGVVKVVTGKDFPYKFGLYMKDRYIFAQDRVRFIGEQVAAVIARDPRIAQKAAKLVKVEYEPLQPVFDPIEALK